MVTAKAIRPRTCWLSDFFQCAMPPDQTCQENKCPALLEAAAGKYGPAWKQAAQDYIQAGAMCSGI